MEGGGPRFAQVERSLVDGEKLGDANGSSQTYAPSQHASTTGAAWYMISASQAWRAVGKELELGLGGWLEKKWHVFQRGASQ